MYRLKIYIDLPVVFRFIRNPEEVIFELYHQKVLEALALQHIQSAPCTLAGHRSAHVPPPLMIQSS